MKKIISAILILALCLSLSSCDMLKNTPIGQLIPSIGSINYKENTVKSAADKITVGFTDHRQPEFMNFLDKLDRFTAKLTYEIYSDAEGDENLVISPVSVYMALALAVECSGGETRDEILNAVGVSYDEVLRFTKYIYAYTNREYYSDGNQLSAMVQLANSIWADDEVQLKDSGVSNLANDYNCDIYRVDFGSADANKSINAYIKDMTHGLIDGNVDLSPQTIITIINTFYLKDIWNEYGKNLTFTSDPYSFINADGSTTDTKLLRGYYNAGRVYEGDGYTSFYTTTEHNFKINFILPDEGYTIADVLTAENLYTINNITDYGYVDDENRLVHYTRVLFPEFKASFDDDIADTLKGEFDINRLFDSENCDFSNIVGDTAWCDGIIHQCCLEVNKTGIEGAAVTYIPVNGSAAPPDYEEVYHDMVIDRAFGFVITDFYGNVVFCGVINKV